MKRLRDKSVLTGLFLTGLVLAHVAYYFPRVVDDVFISLRYAENLATGRGAVYNPGERVEGFSSPAWMFVQTLGIALRLEPVTFTKLAGIACLLATAFGVRALAREVYDVHGWPAWIPAFGCAANSYLVDWTVLGLETPLHVAAIVFCPLAIHRALTSPSRKATCWAVIAIVTLGTSRPESALYVGVNVAAPFAFVRTREAALYLARRGWRVAVLSGGILAGLLALRLGYYGEVVPNTYFVKGAHASFEIAKLGALWRQGATPIEALAFAGGAVVLAVYAVKRRALAPALSVLICLYFTASVAVDWMPSLRHLLPVTVLAPIGWACVVDDLRKGSTPSFSRVAAGLLVFTALQVASVDVRLSPIERTDRWVVRKSREKWQDTLFAYRRAEPPHISRMDSYEMGQISQAWAVLEASDAPVEDSWYAGRDVGAVGFYTGVRVFDTAGLVTRAVSRSTAWAARGEVPDELLARMMEKQPLAADVFDGWDRALGKHPRYLATYRIRMGGPDAPTGIVAIDRSRPGREEILRRYRAFVAKLPRRYHVATLYGESMGAAAVRRLRVVESGPI